MELADFRKAVLEGIPAEIPEKKEFDKEISHAPVRKDILSAEEKRLALKNALRYFPKSSMKF